MTPAPKDTAAAPAAATEEPLLYRFFIYETHDGGRNLRLLGDLLAKDRDAATRSFLGEPVQRIEGEYVAFSENALKLKHVDIEPRARFSELPLPLGVREKPSLPGERSGPDVQDDQGEKGTPEVNGAPQHVSIEPATEHSEAALA